ncbi:MinD/ParA family ATP-binding protein [Microbacterium sp. CJ88]|uniref:MinD/ParA family ATP-binding protein n=1 Tax=Microbacterium sp. CJ88 TaxID=3445672 RepID=UPI003F65805B
MTPDRKDENPDAAADRGVLPDAGRVDTARFDILGGHTAQIRVVIPADADDDLADDGVVDDAVGSREAVESVASDDAVDEPLDAVEAELVDDGTEEVAVDDAGGADASSDDEVMAEVVTETGEIAPPSVQVPVVPAFAGGTGDVAAAAAPAQPVVPVAPPAASIASVAPAEPASVSGSIPTSRRAAHHPHPEPAQTVERAHPRVEVALASKRLGEFEPDREAPDLLTADRLLDPAHIVRPEPEGAWQHFWYSISGKRINLGDGRRARRRKELDRRIAAPLSGNARFVPVLSRKGGVGKTTVTTLLGMALADARDDRVIAIDANPDRGTLAERIARVTHKTIRDLVRVRGEVRGYNDISAIVARDETRLDVLASDADPRVSEALNDRDYNDVASLAAHYYSIVLTDTGTGIVDSVMGAALDVADALVIVAGLSVDEARLASETLTWLETNGYAEQVRAAVVVLNSARPGAPLVRIDELEAHFRTRVRTVVRMPYDPLIAAGSAITFRDLQPETRLAARELAATVVEGLRSLAPAA